MRTIDFPKGTPVVPGEQTQTRGPFEGELMDLYVAILIVVPVAWFVKSLLS